MSMTIRDFAAIEIRDQLTVAIRAGMCEGDSASATRFELSVPRETLGFDGGGGQRLLA